MWLFGHEILKKNCNMIFPKWGGGVKGRLEFFRKLIRFGGATYPLQHSHNTWATTTSLPRSWWQPHDHNILQRPRLGWRRWRPIYLTDEMQYFLLNRIKHVSLKYVMDIGSHHRSEKHLINHFWTSLNYWNMRLLIFTGQGRITEVTRLEAKVLWRSSPAVGWWTDRIVIGDFFFTILIFLNLFLFFFTFF